MTNCILKILRGVFLGLVVCTAAFGQAEEPLSIDATQLPVIGRTETLSGSRVLKLFPLEDGVFSQKLEFPGTSSFRVHFTVLNSPGTFSTNWNLRILNFENNQEQWMFQPEASTRGFWSPEITGSRARVLLTTEPSAANLQIIIDKVSHLQSITTPQTQINFKLKPIGQSSSFIQSAGRAVARLVIERDGDEGPVTCTGFLIGRDLLMTNRHCIKSGSEARNTDVQFDYDRDGAPTVKAGVKELVMASCDLDFVILRLNKSFSCPTALCTGPLERSPFALARNATLTLNQQLLAIQHPDGEAKQVSRDGCVVDQLQMIGSSSTITDFAHKCDTKGGSSGTALLILGNGDAVGPVVGLHHLGTRVDSVQESEPKLINRAVNMRDIVIYIDRVKPGLATELVIH
jgi:hypothetical protein